MQPNEHVVRQFAYQIWESEGKPDGQAARHWEMACKLAGGEMGPADPFEPLSNINTYAVPQDQAGSPANEPNHGREDSSPQVSASMEEPAPAKAPRSRVKAKAIIDDPDAAPKKRASRATKKNPQVT